MDRIRVIAPATTLELASRLNRELSTWLRSQRPSYTFLVSLRTCTSGRTKDFEADHSINRSLEPVCIQRFASARRERQACSLRGHPSDDGIRAIRADKICAGALAETVGETPKHDLSGFEGEQNEDLAKWF
jgi:hypothetical protein